MKILTKNEVAELLQVSPQTINFWIKTNQIPYSRTGKRAVRFLESRIEAWMKERENVQYRMNASQER